MDRSKQPTVLGLLGPIVTVRTRRKPRTERWFQRSDGRLSDRLLANAVLWPVDSKRILRRDLRQRSL